MEHTWFMKLVAVLTIIGAFLLISGTASPTYASSTHIDSSQPNAGFPGNALWTWTGTNIQAWLGPQECDSTSGVHYNLHVQNKGGGTDFHNYHISGVRGNDALYYKWIVVDVGGTQGNSTRGYEQPNFYSLDDAALYTLGDFTYDLGNDTGNSSLANAFYNYSRNGIASYNKAYFVTVYNDRNLDCEH